jgi:arsenate reductase-like glutaredoxin family protein
MPHLQAGCWYIECGKSICPIEEEEMKAACNKADSKGAELGPDHVDDAEELTNADLTMLPEKERNKILTKEQGMLRRPRTRQTGRPRGPLLKP